MSLRVKTLLSRPVQTLGPGTGPRTARSEIFPRTSNIPWFTTWPLLGEFTFEYARLSNIFSGFLLVLNHHLQFTWLSHRRRERPTHTPQQICPFPFLHEGGPDRARGLINSKPLVMNVMAGNALLSLHYAGSLRSIRDLCISRLSSSHFTCFKIDDLAISLRYCFCYGVFAMQTVIWWVDSFGDLGFMNYCLSSGLRWWSFRCSNPSSHHYLK